MRPMKRFAMGSLAALAIVMAGCAKDAKVTYAAMGDASPAFGAGEYATMDKFVVGRWCLHESMMGKGEVTPSRYYEFKADGTFEAGDTEKEWKTAGKWTLAQGNTINLTYDTFNGKPTQQFKDEYKKAEEGGTQAAVARALQFDAIFSQLDRMGTLSVGENPKLLSFGGGAPAAPPGMPGGEMGGGGLEQMMQSMGGLGLERMSAKKG